MTAGCTIALQYNVEIPPYAFIILGTVNIAFPLGILIYQIVIYSKENKAFLKKIKDLESEEDKLVFLIIIQDLDV